MKFWMPQHKHQYVTWLEDRYPNDKSFKRMKLDQLKAIYIRTRSKER